MNDVFNLNGGIGLEMFLKIGVLKNFAEFIGKQPCWSFFLDKVAGFQLAILFKKESGIVAFL